VVQRGRLQSVYERAVLALAAGLILWGFVHALTPRADAAIDLDFAAAAAWVKSRATPTDAVLVRPTWELRGARAFLPLATGVYKSPVPALWAGRTNLFVVTAHGAEPPSALATALRLGERRRFGAVEVHRFDVPR
jgi:hypothetical protein